MIAKSPSMLRILEIIDRVAPTEATVLITGESGTGKELVARRIHEKSGRKGRFEILDCGAIPETLFEMELFGAKAGAYTDARKDIEGKFQSANLGTLFLDEIGNLPLSSQAKLLRVIETKTCRPLGSSDRSKQYDVRILVATNENLEELCGNGEFRFDLYQRLKFISVHIPPLRERPEDIEALCHHFGKVPREVLITFKSHSWPGNVRELKNRIESDLILYGEVRPLGFDEMDLSGASLESIALNNILSGKALPELLDTIERISIVSSMSLCEKKTDAAKLLGIKRTTLVEKLRKMGELEDRNTGKEELKSTIKRLKRDLERMSVPKVAEKYGYSDQWVQIIKDGKAWKSL